MRTCLVPRRLSLYENVHAKEGGKETMGMIGDLLRRTGLWDRQGGRNCELWDIDWRICCDFYEKHYLNHFNLFLFIASLTGVFFGAR